MSINWTPLDVSILQRTSKAAKDASKKVNPGEFYVEYPNDGKYMSTTELVVIPLMKILSHRERTSYNFATKTASAVCSSMDGNVGFLNGDITNGILCSGCNYRSVKDKNGCRFSLLWPVYLVDFDEVAMLRLSSGHVESLKVWNNELFSKYRDIWRNKSGDADARLPYHRLKFALKTTPKNSQYGTNYYLDFASSGWYNDEALYNKIVPIVKEAYEQYMPNLNTEAIEKAKTQPVAQPAQPTTQPPQQFVPDFSAPPEF